MKDGYMKARRFACWKKKRVTGGGKSGERVRPGRGYDKLFDVAE
jgi:hypothetical protein